MARAEESKLRLEDFTVGAEISKGSFGVVYKLVRKADQRVFALKQVKLAGMKRVDRQEAIDEARVLAQLNHPHITKHYGSFIDKDDKLNIIMEYASGGNVSTLIKSYRGKGLPEDMVWKVLIQSLSGLYHIHGKKIIHRDIKALNLFLDANMNIKIGDLGIARALSDGSDFARTIVGTPYYLAPELCEDKPYNEKSDVWALGVVLYECCMGRYPFEAQNEGALIRKILRGQYTPVSGPYTGSLVQAIHLMLTFKPVERPDASQLLRNPVIQQKAKSLSLELYPQPSQSSTEDAPVYESAQPALPAGPGQQQQQRQQHIAAGPHPFDLPPQAPQVPVRQPVHVDLNQPYALHNAAPNQNSFDRMADEIERMQLGIQAANAHKMQPQGAVHQGQRDHVQALFGHPQAPTPVNDRLRPEALPAAGMKQRADRQGAPFALHNSVVPVQSASAALQETAIWGAQYAAPQYGRRRCPELQITGPSMRGAGGRPGSAAKGGGYIPAADDATSYVSSSYATYYK